MKKVICLLLIMVMIVITDVVYSENYEGVVCDTSFGNFVSATGLSDFGILDASLAIDSICVSDLMWGYQKPVSSKTYITGFKERCDTSWTIHKGEFQAFYGGDCQ